MNKAELLADLGTIFDAVGTPQVARAADANIEWYKVRVFRLLGSDGIVDKILNFSVVDEGSPSEEARYVPQRPSVYDANAFRAEVQLMLDTAIVAGTGNIKAGWISRVDETNEKADAELDFIWYIKA
jgi:hypothetical protein